MKCIKCYREIEEGMKFCPKCGFMQPSDRAAYEREHPELVTAMPEDETLKINIPVDKPNTEGYIIPPLPPALPPTQPTNPEEDKIEIEIPTLPSPKEVTLTSNTPIDAPQPSNGQRTMECPICHRPIAFGSHQCQHCKQQLDWSNSAPATKENVDSKSSKRGGVMWIVLAILLAFLLGLAGYYIYNSVKENKHKSRHHYVDEESQSDESDYHFYLYDDEPTGVASWDAQQAADELIELMENTYITSSEDVEQLERDIKDIEEKYENYYRDRLDEFEKEFEKLENDPELNRRIDRALERLQRQIENID
ncbi:MAG: zinc ribbon domain-containing protein [Muribaculaceae bacterium]|nr:zinc ribbon domain-containing protein [Muribaculaceae bacterium]